VGGGRVRSPVAVLDIEVLGHRAVNPRTADGGGMKLSLLAEDAMKESSARGRNASVRCQPNHTGRRSMPPKKRSTSTAPAAARRD